MFSLLVENLLSVFKRVTRELVGVVVEGNYFSILIKLWLFAPFR